MFCKMKCLYKNFEINNFIKNYTFCFSITKYVKFDIFQNKTPLYIFN